MSEARPAKLIPSEVSRRFFFAFAPANVPDHAERNLSAVCLRLRNSGVAEIFDSGIFNRPRCVFAQRNLKRSFGRQNVDRQAAVPERYSQSQLLLAF